MKLTWLRHIGPKVSCEALYVAQVSGEKILIGIMIHMKRMNNSTKCFAENKA